MRLFAVFAALCAAPLLALDVSGLEAGNHIAGPTLREKDLDGKVVAVDEWGIFCPPCRASLPHMAKLAKELAGDERVVFVGSHVQRRDDATARAMLEKAGCDYPVYQGFRVAGAPSSNAIPFGYVVDHRGEVVWSGNPYGDLKGFTQAIEEAAKAVPKAIPGSLLDGMEVRFAKDMPRRLIVGRNAEGALQLLRAGKGGHGVLHAPAVQNLAAERAQRRPRLFLVLAHRQPVHPFLTSPFILPPSAPSFKTSKSPGSPGLFAFAVYSQSSAKASSAGSTSAACQG